MLVIYNEILRRTIILQFIILNTLVILFTTTNITTKLLNILYIYIYMYS